MKSIIDCFSELLPASDIPFGRLHRSVTWEKLNLLEFAEGLQIGEESTVPAPPAPNPLVPATKDKANEQVGEVAKQKKPAE